MTPQQKRDAWNRMSPETKSFAVHLKKSFGQIDLVSFKTKATASGDTVASCNSILEQNISTTGRAADVSHYK